MCFSASASFVASGALTTSGIAIARTPKKKNQIPLSLFPIIFGIHQFIEGILWLTDSGVLPVTYKMGAVSGFVSIAYVLWPIYVPFSALMFETGKIRRVIILICQIIGLCVGGIFFLNILRNPLDAVVIGRSFAYTLKSPEMVLLPYLISVSIPFLVSSDKRLVYFGVALTISCVTAAIIATSYTFPSVWCFFAAILSLSLLWYFKVSARNHLSKETV